MINFSELLWSSGPRPEKRAESREVDEPSRRSPSAVNFAVDRLEVTATNKIALIASPRSPGADRFRYLRLKLREMRGLAKLQKLVITSPLPQDGKSTIALNLATALAHGGQRSVLLIDGDMHNPSLAEMMNLTGRPGLAEVLEDGADPLSLIRKLQPLNICFLHAGEAKGNPTELLQSENARDLMLKLESHFDWIITDTPPVTLLTDALFLAEQSDASMLVVRANQTARDSADHALALLGQKHVVGVVLNGADEDTPAYGAYPAYYGQKKK